MGEAYLVAGDYSQAEHHLLHAVADAEEHHRAAATQVLLRLQLAEAQRKLGKLEKARQTLSAATVFVVRDGNTAAYVECLDEMAWIFEAAGNFSEVQKLLEEAGRIEAGLPHPNHRNVARRTWRLGIARHEMGQDASSLLEKAVMLCEQAYGAESRETGDKLTQLGLIYDRQGKHAETQRCLQRALRIHANVCGSDSKEALEDCQHLAGSFEESGNLEAAAAQYERLLTEIQRTVGCNLDEVAEMQCRIARAYTRWSNYARARELLSEAIGTFSRTKGPRLAATLESLAQVEELSGHARSAIAELHRASVIWESSGQEHRTELVRNVRKRADLHAVLQETEQSQWLRERASELLV